jgi:hypothetical protein
LLLLITLNIHREISALSIVTSHEAGVTLEEIPSFNSAVHGIVSLKNVFDFRPKVDATSFVSGFANVSSRQSIND